MSKTNLAHVFANAANAESDRHLGPAEVVRVDASSVEVRLEDGSTVTAELALATPYRPALGDRLLVIGDAHRAWVIGVIAGSGKTVLAFDGDVELRSNDGVLRLAGGQRVEIESPEVNLHAGRMRLMAESLAQHVTSLSQRVRELFSTHAGSKREIVDGTSAMQAKNATLTTEGSVKINGKAIHLG